MVQDKKSKDAKSPALIALTRLGTCRSRDPRTCSRAVHPQLFHDSLLDFPSAVPQSPTTMPASPDVRPYRTLATVFVAWKAFLLLIAAGSQVGPTYDTSSSLLTASTSGGHVPDLVTRLSSWDAIFFIKSAERGYLFEQEWAFGSALPTCIALLIRGESHFIHRLAATVLTPSSSPCLPGPHQPSRDRTPDPSHRDPLHQRLPLPLHPSSLPPRPARLGRLLRHLGPRRGPAARAFPGGSLPIRALRRKSLLPSFLLRVAVAGEELPRWLGRET